MRFLMMAMLTIGCGTSQLHAQSDSLPQVNQAEVIRLGDTVQHVGTHSQGEEISDAFVAAMGPPASDADKWFISVVTTRGCAACQQLKHAWTVNEWLLALANPSDASQSWAHYHVYDRSDQSQAFRFENVRITTYPTILVQPPRSGDYGEASTVVFQGVYQGDPEQLARSITTAIRRYVGQIRPQAVTSQSDSAGPIGSDPPWQPVPRNEPWQPSPRPDFPELDPAIPPAVPVPSVAGSKIMKIYIGAVTLPFVVALVVWGITYLRARRQAAGIPPIVDQKALDQILELLKQRAEPETQQAQPSSSGE